MGVSGAWAQKSRKDYTGATKWGTGINPIHGVRDSGRGRELGTKLNPLPQGPPADAVADGLTADEVEWYDCAPGTDQEVRDGSEVFRYQDERPTWGEVTPQFRDATNSPVMGETPSWGVVFDANPVDGFPLPGPTAGQQTWLDVDHGDIAEQQRAVAVPTAPVAGGWQAKTTAARLASSDSAQEVPQDGYQYGLNTSVTQGQGINQLDNERALARGTDAPRSGIRSRTAAPIMRSWARSWRNGGGAGAPDMFPQQQTTGMKRPFLTRAPALPRPETHQFNSPEGRVPILRSVPPEPFQGDPENLIGGGEDGGWF